MKKSIKLTIILVILLIAAVLLFPYTKENALHGTGEIRSASKELIGACSLEIEIKESRSILLSYHKYFTLTLDGQKYEEFTLKPTVSEADGLCLISQMFYDADKGHLNVCALVYPEDFSYAVISLDDKLYCLNCDAYIPLDIPPYIQ